MIYNPTFQIFKCSASSEYHYRLRATNGEIILYGEGYTTKQSFLDGIVSVKVNTPFDIRFDRRDGVNNYSFNLKVSNGEIIGRSKNTLLLWQKKTECLQSKKRTSIPY